MTDDDREAIADDPEIQAIVARMAAREAPDLATLRAICERIGYGRVMQAASSMWRERLAPDGLAGGEHTCGPCQSTLDRAGVESGLELLMAWETLSEDVRAEALRQVREGE